MARAASEEPRGLVYRRELLAVEEEVELLAELEALRFDPIVMHGREARRTARHFGLDYDYEARTPKPGEPVPAWREPVRTRAAELGAEPIPLNSAVRLGRTCPRMSCWCGLGIVVP